jgi:hypothetical protein
MEQLECINWGNDSTVYHSGNKEYVIKVYDGMMKKLDMNSCLEMLKQYSEDTLKAADTINRELVKSYKRRFHFDSEYYDINVSIIPQGNIQIISAPTADKPLRVKKEMYIAGVGQKYIRGMNLSDIINGYNWNTGDSIFYHSINSFESSMKSSINNIQEIIFETINISFKINEANIKPILKESTHTIDLVITDLADNIMTTYSP